MQAAPDGTVTFEDEKLIDAQLWKRIGPVEKDEFHALENKAKGFLTATSATSFPVIKGNITLR